MYLIDIERKLQLKKETNSHLRGLTLSTSSHYSEIACLIPPAPFYIYNLLVTTLFIQLALLT